MSDLIERIALRFKSGNDVPIERAHITVAEWEELRRDAERYRWLRDNENVSLYLTRNDHAAVYKTATQAMEDAASCGDDSFDDSTPEEVQKMKDDNTIWSLQIYPNTPIGFNLWHAATLDAAIDAARGAEVEG